MKTKKIEGNSSLDLEKDTTNNLKAHEILFLTFLSLMRYPQKQMNEIAERYVEYYYRDCLRLKEKPSIPAKAHVIFEPDKEILGSKSFTLKKGALLTTDKDNNEEQVFYETENDLSISHAQIVGIKTISGIKSGLVETTIFNPEDEVFTPKIFKTFGETKQDVVTELGFAISAPILHMHPGRSNVLTLTLELKERNENIKHIKEAFAEQCPFKFYLTTEKNWIELNIQNPIKCSANEIIFTFNIEEVIAYPSEYDCGIYFDNNYPILKVLLDNREKYDSLKLLEIENIKLELKVEEAGGLKIANDMGELNPNIKMIYPFGLQPDIGSSFYFTHPDLSGKGLSELNLTMQWLGLPTDYQAINNALKVRSVFSNGVKDIELSDEDLFTQTPDGLVKSTVINIIKVPQNEINAQLNKAKISSLQSENPIEWPCYFILSLKDDLLHSILNPPYAPLCSKITISYKATVELVLDDPKTFKYLGPDIAHNNRNNMRNLIPDYPNSGCLFISIINLHPQDGHLSMLWQAGGEARSEIATVEWQYLSSKDGWQICEIEEDSTKNLSDSGIITFKINHDIFKSQITNQCYLRAVLKNGIGVCDSLDIKLHAATVYFSKQNNSTKDFSSLEPLKINNLFTPNPLIKKISQPYESFEGKRAEDEQDFYKRIRARLKHKGRAVNAWDYEELVLAEFPEVNNVRTELKNINQSEKGRSSELVIYIKVSTQYSVSADPKSPTAAVRLLHQIESYLKRHCSPFVKLRVANEEANVKEQECVIKVEFKGNNNNEILQENNN